jgi:DNA-binding transcriptional LysR family regulator
MQLGQEALGWELILGMVAAGFGVSLVPASSCLLRNVGVIYLPLRKETPTFDLALAWLSDNKSPLLHHFLEVACETYQR